MQILVTRQLTKMFQVASVAANISIRVSILQHLTYSTHGPWGDFPSPTVLMGQFISSPGCVAAGPQTTDWLISHNFDAPFSPLFQMDNTSVQCTSSLSLVLILDSLFLAVLTLHKRNTTKWLYIELVRTCSSW